VCSLTPPTGYVAVAGDTCPTDAAKLEPGQCGCGTADTDSDADGTADCNDTTPALRLIPRSSGLFDSGDGYVTVDVELGARLSTQSTVGAQLALHYDTTKLSFVSVDAGSATAGNGLFSQPVFLNHTAAAGTILYGVGVADTFAGSTTATRVATLTFRVADGVTAICGTADLVRFQAVGSVVTRLSDSSGGEILPTTFNLGSITAYSALVGFQSVPSVWSRPADAGQLGSLYSQPSVTYIAPCSVPLNTMPVTVEHDLPGGGTTWVSGWPAGNLFPVGITTVRWSANGQTVDRTFEVLNYQVMDLSVALEGAGITANSRELSVVTGAFAGTVTANLSHVATTVSVQVPVVASYDCVSVKNNSHTLRHTATVTVSGTKYVASFSGFSNSLKQGDSNNDNTVDILDFGRYVADFGAAAASGRSNFDGNAAVNSTDFSYISFNFFQRGSDGCSASLDGGLASDGPMERVSIAQLHKLGCSELSMADLNGDGWLDVTDMDLWMQGVRPNQGAGSSSSGGNSAE
jgi:hypothetical protein